jgi:transposase-like protein
MSSSTQPTGGGTAAGQGTARRRKRRKLAPSQKYEIFTSVLTSAATQRDLAEKYGVDRTTIRSICATAKQGAIDALAAAVPGRRGKTVEQAELDDARAEIERLRATICEQAVSLHLEKGKDGWE